MATAELRLPLCLRHRDSWEPATMAKKTLADLGGPARQARAGPRRFQRAAGRRPATSPTTAASAARCRRSQALLDAGAAVIVMSHLGRPRATRQGRPTSARRTASARSPSFGELLGRPVTKVDEVVGPAVDAAATRAEAGRGAGAGEPALPPRRAGEATPSSPRELASLGDVYVNDAFGTCHRSDASMVAVPAAIKAASRASSASWSPRNWRSSTAAVQPAAGRCSASSAGPRCRTRSASSRRCWAGSIASSSAAR